MICSFAGIRRRIASYMDLQSFSSLRITSNSCYESLKLSDLGSLAIKQHVSKVALVRAGFAASEPLQESVKSIINCGVDLVRLLRNLKGPQLPVRHVLSSGHFEDSSGPNRNGKASRDSTCGAFIRSVPKYRAGDELLQQRWRASTIQGMARDLLPVIHLGEIIQKASNSRVRTGLLIGKHASVANLASRAGRDAELAAAAIPCGAAFVALQGVMPQIGLSTPDVFPSTYWRGQEDMLHSRPSWYRQATGFLRSGVVQPLPLPVVPSLPHHDTGAPGRMRETGLPQQDSSVIRRHGVLASVVPSDCPAMLSGDEQQTDSPTGICHGPPVPGLQSSRCYGVSADCSKNSAAEVTAHTQAQPRLAEPTDELLFSSWYNTQAKLLDNRESEASDARDPHQWFDLWGRMHCKGDREYGRRMALTPSPDLERVHCCGCNVGGCVASQICLCQLFLLLALTAVASYLIQDVWRPACIRNALAIGLSSSSSNSAVGRWMQSGTNVRIPETASLASLPQLEENETLRADIVHQSARYCNLPSTPKQWQAQGEQLFVELADITPVSSVDVCILVLLGAGMLQIIAACMYHGVRAKKPCAPASMAWTCLLQALVCGRDGDRLSPIVTIDKLPVKAPVLLGGISGRSVAALFWIVSALTVLIARPLAHAADTAFAERRPIPHSNLGSIAAIGTLGGCAGALLPLVFDLLPHPNRLYQTAIMLASAEHLYWPMTGRRKLSVPGYAEPKQAYVGQSLFCSRSLQHVGYAFAVLLSGAPVAIILATDRFEVQGTSSHLLQTLPLLLFALTWLVANLCATFVRVGERPPISADFVLGRASAGEHIPNCNSWFWPQCESVFPDHPSHASRTKLCCKATSYALSGAIWLTVQLVWMTAAFQGPVGPSGTLHVVLGGAIPLMCVYVGAICSRQQWRAYHNRAASHTVRFGHTIISRDFGQLRDRTRLVESVSSLAVGILSKIGSTESLLRDARAQSQVTAQRGLSLPSRINPVRGFGRLLISYQGDQPTAIPLSTGSSLSSTSAATMMSTWDHSNMIQVLDLPTSRSICRVLDSVLLCMGLLQACDSKADHIVARAHEQSTSNSDSDADSKTSEPDIRQSDARVANDMVISGAAGALAAVARCLVEVLKHQPYVEANLINLITHEQAERVWRLAGHSITREWNLPDVGYQEGSISLGHQRSASAARSCLSTLPELEQLQVAVARATHPLQRHRAVEQVMKAQPPPPSQPVGDVYQSPAQKAVAPFQSSSSQSPYVCSFKVCEKLKWMGLDT